MITENIVKEIYKTIKDMVLSKTSSNKNGFSLVEVVIAVAIVGIVVTGTFTAILKTQETSQKLLVNNAVNEVYTAAISKKDSNDGSSENPAFVAADQWVQSSDKDSAKGVDLRGFMIDENGNITEDKNDTIVIVGVSKGLGYDKDGYPYFYWRSDFKIDKAEMWQLLQKHNQYLEQQKQNNEE